MSESPDTPLECRVTRWYYWRMAKIALLFLAAALWFGFDAMIGYPKANTIARHHAWFEDKVQSTYYQHISTGQLEQWYETAEESNWPAGEHGQPPTWATYAAQNGWPAIPPKFRTDEEIRTQYYIAIAALLGLLITGVITSIHRRLPLLADAESFTTPNGVKIPFGSVKEIDRRPWPNRGFARITYEDHNGKLGKTVIDDLKFGGADKILDRLIANFDGVLIDEVTTDESNDGDASDGASDTAQQVS